MGLVLKMKSLYGSILLKDIWSLGLGVINTGFYINNIFSYIIYMFDGVSLYLSFFYLLGVGNYNIYWLLYFFFIILILLKWSGFGQLGGVYPIYYIILKSSKYIIEWGLGIL